MISRLSVTSLVCCSFLATLSLAGSLEKEFDFPASSVTVAQCDGYDVVGLEGCVGTTQSVGKPALPFADVRFLIPPSAEITRVEVLETTWVDVPGAFNVYPAQFPNPTDDASVALPVTSDSSIYQSPQEYPGRLTEIVPSGCKSGFRIAGLFLYPLQYIPREKRLVLCKKMKVRIDYEEGRHEIWSLTPSQRGTFWPGVRDLVINPEDAGGFSPPTRSSLNADIDYVILTGTSLESKFTPLVNWLRKTGLWAETRTVSWVDDNYAGRDRQERIRNFIRDYFRTEGLKYILLAGDVSIIPERRAFCDVGGGYRDNIPCDLYYFDLQWSWDSNHNDAFGEWHVGEGGPDTVDLYGDLYGGRWSVETSAEVDTVIRKLMTYVKKPDTLYQKRLLLPAAFIAFGYNSLQVQDTIASFIPVGWTANILDQGTNFGLTEQVKDSLSSGYAFCHLVAHGAAVSTRIVDSANMNWVSQYSCADAQGQTNYDRLTIFNSIACDPGDFTVQDCLAEDIVKARGSGIASIMNSSLGWCILSDLLDVGFYDYFFGHDLTSLAECHQTSKEFYRNQALVDGHRRWCYYALNLLGEPSMTMWKDSPKRMNASFIDPISTVYQTFTVTVTSQGSPVPRAAVTVWKGSEVYSKGVTNAGGQTDLRICPQSAGYMYVTAVAPGKTPYEDSCQVVFTQLPENDVALDSVICPVGEHWTYTPMVPVALVRNCGTLSQTAFPVLCSLVGAGGAIRYADQQTVASLAAGDTIRVSFHSWTPVIAELCTVRMQVSLLGDQNPLNDPRTRMSDMRSCVVTIASPVGGEAWAGGSNQVIEWRTLGSGLDRYRLLLSTNGGSDYPDTIAQRVAATETTFGWQVLPVNSTRCRVAVQTLDTSGLVISQDASFGNFTVDSDRPSSFGLLDPPDGYWSSEVPTFVWHRTTDDSTVLHYQWFVDDFLGMDWMSDTTYCYGPKWTQTTDAAQWSVRQGHTSVAFDNKIWVLGGCDGNYNCRNDVWYSSDGANWIRATYNAGWARRYGHTSVVFDNKMWVIGGYDYNNNPCNDVWYSSDGANWVVATANAGWSPRGDQTSAVFDDKMWVLGGNQEGNNYSDAWYSSDGVDWTRATYTAGWARRYGHTSVVFDNKMWVLGGRTWSGNDPLNDVWYSSDGRTWTLAVWPAGWSARYEHTSVVFDNKMWVLGGYGVFDVWYSSDGANWTQASESAGWLTRYGHTSAVSDSKMWVLAGSDGGYPHETYGNDVWCMQSVASLPEGRSSWYIRAVDLAGNWQQSSQTFSIGIDTSPPGAFGLSRPGDNDTVHTQRPRFYWHPAQDTFSGVGKYQLWVNGSEILDSIPASDTSAIPAAPLPNCSTSTWFVRAFDRVGESCSSSETLRVVVRRYDSIPPSIPVLIAPVDGFCTRDTLLAYCWHKSIDDTSGIECYTLQYAANPEFVGATQVDVSDTACQTQTRLVDTAYYWRVMAVDSAGTQSSWSTVWSFKVDTRAPNVPSLLEPVGGAWRNTPNVVFRWSGVSFLGGMLAAGSALPGFAKSVTLAEARATKKPLLRLTHVSRADTKSSFISPQADDAYTTAQHAIGTSAGTYSRPVDIHIVPPAVALDIPPRRNPSGDESRICAVPVAYVLQIDTTSDFANPLVVDTTMLTQDTATIAARVRYYWRVRAFDLAGNQGSFSSADSFGVDILPPTIPVLIAPANDTTIQDTAASLVWHRSYDQQSGISNYRVQVALDSGFADLRKDMTIADTFRCFGLPETVYYWRARAMDRAGNQSGWSQSRRFRVGPPEFVVESPSSLPSRTALGSPVPSPFSDAVIIPYDLAVASVVRLAVYDVSGRELAALSGGLLHAGSYQVRWNGRTAAGAMLPSGIYLVRLMAGGWAQTRKLAMQR